MIMSITRVQASGLKHVKVEEIQALYNDYVDGVISQADINEWSWCLDEPEEYGQDKYNERADVTRLLAAMCITTCEQGHICPRCGMVYMTPRIDHAHKLNCGCEGVITLVLEPHTIYPDGSENFKV